MENKIETLKRELNSLLNVKDSNCLDKEVLKKSMELDTYINAEMIKRLRGSVDYHERIYN